MNILEILKAKFAGNQAVLDEIAAEEAQALAADHVAEVGQVTTDIEAQAPSAVEIVVDVDPNRPPARFATLRAAYDEEHGVQA